MSDGCPVCGAARDGWPLCEECMRLVREAGEHRAACVCYSCARFARARDALPHKTFVEVIAGNTSRGGA